MQERKPNVSYKDYIIYVKTKYCLQKILKFYNLIKNMQNIYSLPMYNITNYFFLIASYIIIINCLICIFIVNIYL